MKKIFMIAGVVCILVGGALLVFNLDMIRLTIGDVVHANIQIYPAAFFGLVGLVLVYRSWKSV